MSAALPLLHDEQLRLQLQRITPRSRACVVCLQKTNRCGYDPILGVAACRKVPSARAYGSWGWLHEVTPTPDEYDETCQTVAAPIVPLEDWEAAGRNLLYRYMLQQRACRLSAHDRAELVARGFNDLEIKRHGYSSFPALPARGELAHLLTRYADNSPDARAFAAQYGHTLSSVWWRLPGTYNKAKRHRRGSDTLFTPSVRHGALAIPVADHLGRIIALRLRLRATDPDAQGVRYKWLSCPTGGNKQPAICHVARPNGPHDPRQVIITEGEIKATISADLLGCIVIAVPGVDIFREVPTLLDELRRCGDITPDARVVIAYDADAIVKPQVAAARERLAKTLAQPPRSDHVTLATWHLDQGKGLDDLLLAGGMYTETRYTPPARRGPILLDHIAPMPERDARPLAEATALLRHQINQLIPSRWWPQGLRGIGWHGFQVDPGTGKTRMSLTRLRELHDAGEWPSVREQDTDGKVTHRPMRALYLTDTIDQVREKSEEYLGAQWGIARLLNDDGSRGTSRPYWRRGDERWYAVLDGRNPYPESEGYCANPRAQAVNAQRHIAAVDVCANTQEPCPFHKTCEQTGYLGAVKAIKTAQLVITTKASMLNDSQAIEGYDLVIVDEDATPALVEQIAITPETIALWRKLLNERDPYHDYDHLAVWLDWLEHAAANARAAAGTETRPALATLREAIDHSALARLGLDPRDGPQDLIQAAIGSCRLMVKSEPRAICEEPQPDQPTIPLRAIHDIASALLAEWIRPADADSRLAFTSMGTLVYYRPRTKLLERLAGRRVLWLDATLHPATLQRFAAIAWAQRADPIQVSIHRVAVEQDIEVINVIDKLYSRDQLDQRELTRIAETIAAVAQERHIPEKAVGVLVFKSANPEAPPEHERQTTHPLARFTCGHYGHDDKATDRFAHCQMLVTIGSYTPNIGAIRALQTALRFAEYPPGRADVVRRVIPYPGTDRARERIQDPDPAMQDAIDHATWSHETQALGRLRAVRRDTSLLWLRFNAAPYRDLSGELTSHDDLRADLGLTRIRTGTDPRYAGLREKAAKKRDVANRLCALAWSQLTTQGTTAITVSLLSRTAGVGRAMARRWMVWQHRDTDICQGGSNVRSIYSNGNGGSTPTYIPEKGDQPRPDMAAQPSGSGMYQGGSTVTITISIPNGGSTPTYIPEHLQHIPKHGSVSSFTERAQGENGIVCVLPKQQLDLYSHSGNVQTIQMPPPSASSVPPTTRIVSADIPPPSVAPPPIPLGERVAQLERANPPPMRTPSQTPPESDVIASSKGASV